VNLDAVILAGGKSSRMGRNKAGLEFEGETLLARQIKLARSAGAKRVFISGSAAADDTGHGFVIADNFLNAGPLAGIESALKSSSEPLLLVLAVDMPMLRRNWLDTLLTYCTPHCGVVPRIAGQLEPLAAIYPRRSALLATALLTEAKQFCVGPRHFVAQCEREGFVQILDLPAEAAADFLSWNTPQDIPGARDRS
jgi:molybdopterin-guanine dinucleotide biosynthesis protein A